MDNYLTILEESLQKKLKLLDKIAAYNEAQQQVFSEENVQLDKFDAYIEEKGRLIEQVLRLDDGFETLYANVSKELQENKAKYAEQIHRLQEMVKQVTEKSVSVQAQESRNKALVESYFAKEKNQIGQGRQRSKAAYDYYKSMSKSSYVGPQYYDNKK